ncbi:MAG TPA: DUF4157 domain-containing protein [Candidatus Dormibacteraeota bacterium]|nr:DUF4157 domain-containing protein [Candidatus Dormibacteraeota bacterium]
MDAHEFERAAVRAMRPQQRPADVGDASRHDLPSSVLGLQRLAGNESVSALLAGEEEAGVSPVREVVGSGGGSPLDPGARSFLEGRLGADFSEVRIHTGARADESARSVSAQAYTVGEDVVFRRGAYQPDTPAGRHVLAHELAHVVQQRAGPVAGIPAPGGISVSEPGDPFERAAERAADQAMAGEGVAAQRAGAGEYDEETLQTLVAQRAAEVEEEKEVEDLPA